MRTLICTRPGQFDYGRKSRPELIKDHAIVKIKRIGICGTDLHAFEGTQPYFEYPRILGHELSGELVEFDQAPGFEKGEAVTFIPYFNCGNCVACNAGKPNCCVDIKVCGVHIDGGMVEYLSVPSRALVHGEGLNYDTLALVESLAIGAHGVRRAAIKKDEYVLVVGAGPIGLGIMKFAEIAGARIIAMDINDFRLDFCKKIVHEPFTVNPRSADPLQKLKEITHGDMPTVVFDATGSRRAIEAGFKYMAHGGRYVLVGLQKEDISFSHPEFHKREASLLSSRNATREDFEHVIRSIKEGLVDPTAYITHRVSFDRLKVEFEGWLAAPDRIVKPIVELD